MRPVPSPQRLTASTHDPRLLRLRLRTVRGAPVIGNRWWAVPPMLMLAVRVESMIVISSLKGAAHVSLAAGPGPSDSSCVKNLVWLLVGTLLWGTCEVMLGGLVG